MARSSGLYLAGPLALAAILFILSYQAGFSGQADLSGTYLRLGELMIALWFVIVIVNLAGKRRW